MTVVMLAVLNPSGSRTQRLNSLTTWACVLYVPTIIRSQIMFGMKQDVENIYQQIRHLETQASQNDLSVKKDMAGLRAQLTDVFDLIDHLKCDIDMILRFFSIDEDKMKALDVIKEANEEINKITIQGEECTEENKGIASFANEETKENQDVV